MKAKRSIRSVDDDGSEHAIPKDAARKRPKYSETDAQLASIYSDLAEDVKDIRLKAAARLIRTFRTADESTTDRATKRLIRGCLLYTSPSPRY